MLEINLKKTKPKLVSWIQPHPGGVSILCSKCRSPDFEVHALFGSLRCTNCQIDIDDTRRLQATFKDIALALTNPTTVTFKMLEPDGAVTTYNAVGIFYVDWPIAKQGRHAWSLVGTGTVAQKEEDEFYVKRSNA